MDDKNRPIRFGMIGGGQGAFIGGVHRMAARLDGQYELTAGCFSRDYGNTLKTAEELYLDKSRCYRSYQEMADKEAALPPEKRIEAAAVVTPNNTHFDIAATFLEKGFHVICDKPMTYTLDEAVRLVRLVEDSGLVFCLTHNYTGNPLVREARELFKSGEMGEVRKITAEYVQDFLSYPHEKEGMKQAVWRTDPSQSGAGGTIGDVGTHAVNLIEYITGEKITALCADLSTFLPDRRLDEDGNILFKLEKGGKGIIAVSQIAIGEENGLRIKIYGSKGAVLWEQENPNYMRVYFYGRPRQTYTRGSGYLSEEANSVSRIPTGHPEGYLEAFANIYRGAAEAIRAHSAGKSLSVDEYTFPTVYDGLRGMEFISKAVESNRNGSTWVELKS